MRILHLLSNRKWTERAEPAAHLALAQRELGHEALFACSRWTLPDGNERSTGHHLKAMGLDPIILEMPKHFSPVALVRDLPRLRALLAELKPDVLHAHMDNAHLLAALATRGAQSPPLVVRHSYESEGPPSGRRTNWLLRRHTDGLVTLTERAATAAAGYGLTGKQVAAIEPGIDTRRFAATDDKSEARQRLGLPDAAFVAGMVMRIRKDRRPDLGLSLLAKLATTCPDLQLLLVGRGEEVDALQARVKDLGIADRVVMPGYQAGPDLESAYHAMDILVYPVAGTDPSCRTVREAMASGLPVVAGKLGFLADLVEDGKTGILAAVDVACFAEAVGRLYEDRVTTRRMGADAAELAISRFSLEQQALRTISFYNGLKTRPLASGS